MHIQQIGRPLPTAYQPSIANDGGHISMKSSAIRTAASLALVGAMFVSATATAVPFASANLLQRSPSNGTPDVPAPITRIADVSFTSRVAEARVDRSGDWGSASAFGRADLSNGLIGARIAGDAPELGERNLLNVASGALADTFSTTGPNGSPFDWANGHGHFSFTLEGAFSVDPAVDNTQGLFAVVGLTLAKPNTTDPSATPKFSDILAVYTWFIGDSHQTSTLCYADGVCITPEPIDTLTTFPSTFGTDVNVGSDFDWSLVLTLGRATLLPSGNAAKYDLDFSQTLTASYTGPDGTTTQAASGLFRNITNPGTVVPTPSVTIGLFAALLASTRLRRRHRSNR